MLAGSSSWLDPLLLNQLLFDTIFLCLLPVALQFAPSGKGFHFGLEVELPLISLQTSHHDVPCLLGAVARVPDLLWHHPGPQMF